MRCSLLNVALLLLVSGCTRHADRAAQGPGPDAGVRRAAVEAGPADAGYVVLPGTLDRFIQYQARSLALYSKLLDELAKAGSADAGAAAAVARIRRHAQAEEQLRRELGLSDRDVRELEAITGDVLARRAVAAGRGGDAPVKRLEELAAAVPEEQRAQLEATVAALQRQQQAAGSLAEERRRYGDANVDLVLMREAELAREWNRALSAFAGEKNP